MLILATVLGAVALLIFVLAPLRRSPVAQTDRAPAAPAVQALLDQREAALAGLTELDWDHRLGNVNRADYAVLQGQYRQQAIGVLKALDAATGDTERGWDSVPVAAPPGCVHPAAALPSVGRSRAGIAGGAGAAVGGLALLGGLLLWGGRPATDAAAAVPLDVLHAHSALLLPDSDVALIGHHSGLLRSSDGGRSWTAVAGVTGDILALTAAPAPSTELFLAGPGQVRRSRDRGLTWAAGAAPPAAANVTTLTAGAEGTLYAQVRDTGLLVSRAGGPWTLQGGGLPAESSTLIWYPDPVRALFAGGPGVGVLASGDGGRAWGSAGGVVNGALPTLAVWALAVDAASGDTFTGADGTTVRGALYAATDAGLFKTIDGGTSWTGLPLRRPLVAVSARTLPRPLLLAVDSRAVVWRSSDHGSSWSTAP